MILVADAGSSKTHWSLIDNKEIISTRTQGINPVLMNKNIIYEILQTDSLLNPKKQNINTIYFYGAGCSDNSLQENIKTALRKYFPNANINVFSDLYGAARSLFHNTSGIACILGTGAGCCRYDGKQITQRSPSLGFILGDEGSGAFFGKELLKRFFYGRLPKNLEDKLLQKHKIEKKEVLSRIHQQKAPGKYLAEFCYFLDENKNDSYIKKMIEDGLKEFIETHVMDLQPKPNEKIKVTGSVGWFFKDILYTTVKQYGLQIDKKRI